MENMKKKKDQENITVPTLLKEDEEVEGKYNKKNKK